MTSMAFLFPGQGSQYVGMAKDLHEEFDFVREIFDMAEDLAHAHLRKLCFSGPMEDLTRTVTLQPALTAVNLACLAAVTRMAKVSPAMAAGHSLGEYSALAAGGVLSAQDAISLVIERGRLMDRDAQKQPGAMAAIVGLAMEQVREIVDQASQAGLVSVANHNAPTQIVITGEKQAVTEATRLAKEAKARAIPLKVSGAWHSELMADAGKEFADLLKSAPFGDAQLPVALNPTGTLLQDGAEIQAAMARQLTSPVLWCGDVQAMEKAGATTFVEVGPKTVLTGLVKKILPKDGPWKFMNVADLPTLEAFVQAVA